MRPSLRIPSAFPPTNVRSAFNRDWIWPQSDVWGWQHPLEHWPEIERLIKQQTGPKRVAIQAGGCCGLYPWLLSSHYEFVYTFEPDSHNFHCLVANCPSPRIFAFNCALGQGHQTTRLKPNAPQNCGNFHVDWNQLGPIQSLQLDDFTFMPIHGIFLDAESSEDAIIAGGLNQIFLHRPPLIVAETITGAMTEVLHSAGYELQPQLGYDHHFLLKEEAHKTTQSAVT